MLPRLILLGLLMSGPRHGYQISLFLREILARMVRLTPGSIYYHLKKLEKEGLITGSSSRQERGPERRVYSITEKGKEQFVTLAEGNLFTRERPTWQLNCSIFFLRHLDHGRALEALRERLKRLTVERRETKLMEKVAVKMNLPFHLRSLIHHGLLHLEAELNWMKGLLGELEANQGRPVKGADFQQFLGQFQALRERRQ